MFAFVLFGFRESDIKKDLCFCDVRLCHGHIQVSYILHVLTEVNDNLGCHVENMGEQ